MYIHRFLLLNRTLTLCSSSPQTSTHGSPCGLREVDSNPRLGRWLVRGWPILLALDQFTNERKIKFRLVNRLRNLLGNPGKIFLLRELWKEIFLTSSGHCYIGMWRWGRHFRHGTGGTGVPGLSQSGSLFSSVHPGTDCRGDVNFSSLGWGQGAAMWEL